MYVIHYLNAATNAKRIARVEFFSNIARTVYVCRFCVDPSCNSMDFHVNTSLKLSLLFLLDYTIYFLSTVLFQKVNIREAT